MNLTTICDHTICTTLLKPSSKVLDLGCRNFQFSESMLDYVDEVWAVDPDSSIAIPERRRIRFLRGAVGKYNYHAATYVKHGNGTGNYIDRPGLPRPAEHTVDLVPVYSLQSISAIADVDKWDLIKFDIEGSEYDILMDLKEPIADQITFELHEHTPAKRGTQFVDHLIYEHLGQWYDVVFCDYADRHGCGFNYWDVLMIKRGLIFKNDE